MKGRFGNKQRIQHALDAINEIEQYIANQTFDTFLANSMMRFASIKQLEIVGEECNHLDEDLMAKHPEIEWRKIVGLRNLLIHEYFGVDAALVWDILQNNIPDLKIQLTYVIDEL